MKQEYKTIIILVIVYAALISGLYYMLSSDVLSTIYYTEDAGPVISVIQEGTVLFLAAFTLLFTAFALPKVVSGSVVGYISNALIVFGVILAFQVFLASPFVHPDVQALSGNIFIAEITILGFATAYYLSQAYNQRLLPALIKAAAFFAAAFLVGQILLGIQWEYSEYVATAVTVGLLFTGVTVLFYPLKFSGNKILKKLGGWFSSSTKDKFLIGFITTLYLSFIRPSLYSVNSDYTLLGEWICISLIAGGTFYWLRSNLREEMTNQLPLEWYQTAHAPRKHKQKIETKSTKELTVAKEYIDQFVKEGIKGDILFFIITSGHEKGLTFDCVFDVVEDLINYQDLSTPRFTFLKEIEWNKKENIERRRAVLATTIQKLSEAHHQEKGSVAYTTQKLSEQ